MSDEQLEKAQQRAHTRIEQLEERMRGADALIVLWETRATRAEARVEQLEALLREMQRYSVGDNRPRHTWYYDRIEEVFPHPAPEQEK